MYFLPYFVCVLLEVNCVQGGPAEIIEFDFFGNPSVALGMGLGGYLVTIRVLEHPWGPT